MNKQLKIFMSGALVVIPLAITIWLVYEFGSLLARLGTTILVSTGLSEGLAPEYKSAAGGIGVLLVLILVYLIGLMTRLLLFRKLFSFVDRLMGKLPGVKTIYESVRDLMELFGGNAEKMGYPVLYCPNPGGLKMLGIVTNEHPRGRPAGDNSVIVFLPMGYMIGGPIVFADPDKLEKLDIPVETALKLAATAFITKDRVGVGKLEKKSAESN